MKLSQMKENETATIIDIDSNASLSRRLYDMGFMVGEKVHCINVGLFGSPVAYNIRDCKVALRKNDADMIGVMM